MANLRVATFNCAGLGTTARRKTIFDHLRSTDIHLFCLQETHSSSADEIKWAEEWGEARALFHSSSKNDRSNGVALLLNHSAIQFANWFGDQEGRILTADISIQTTKIHVVNIYAPQRNHSLCSRIRFFDSLYSHIYSTHPTILTGDFNMVENSTLDRDPHPIEATQSNLCKIYVLHLIYMIASGCYMEISDSSHADKVNRSQD